MAKFVAGDLYSHADVLSWLELDDQGGGAWHTGLARLQDNHYIFCGVGIGGRTGHDYDNHFEGPELIWRGRTGSQIHQPSIQALVSDVGDVHIFFRDDNRAAFTYAGIGNAVSVKDTIRVEVRWSFADDDGPHPEYIPEEVPNQKGVVEGAKRTVVVNVYERDSAARTRCVQRWGTSCVVCKFDFPKTYGDLGHSYIHVHHLRPFLGKIRRKFVLDPEKDLRSVCPNCHAMLHRRRPALAIDELSTIVEKGGEDVD